MTTPITPTGNPLEPAAAQVEYADATSQAPYSASTVARLRQTHDQLMVAKEQAIRDAARSALTSPDAVLNVIVGIQGLDTNITRVTEQVAQLTSGEIQPSDVTTMRAMKKEGATEAQIATWYDTNQTKINRMLNGQS